MHVASFADTRETAGRVISFRYCSLYIVWGNVSNCKRLTKSLVLKNVLEFGVKGMMVERDGSESEHATLRFRGPA
jgi:hypothetical protein